MNTVKIRTVDDHGLGFVYYDHDMSSIGTAATVIGAANFAVNGVPRSVVIGAA